MYHGIFQSMLVNDGYHQLTSAFLEVSLEREKEQKAIREKEEALRLLECKHTIVELWNEYNPRQFITVSNKYGSVYRIDRNPFEQLARYGRIYGEPKGDRLGAPSEVVIDANEPIWKKNYAI